MLSRDPISTWFDPAARRLLVRAYDHRGAWVVTYLAPPSLEQRMAAIGEGIWDLGERDRWGEVRWVRALKRSVYWNLRYYGRSQRIDFSERRTAAPGPFAATLEWETGPRILKAGWPTRRWEIRVRLHDGGARAFAAVADGRAEPSLGPGERSEPRDRDWG